MKKIFGIIAASITLFGAVSCEDFLNRPSEDSYVVDGFYKNDDAEYRHKLWDHLMMMADWQLDVDTPFPIERPEADQMRPHELHYKDNKMRYRHYGATLEKMIQQVAELPEGEERDVLAAQIAHTMKRSYLTWNSDTVEDSLIVEQMAEMSDNRLQPPADFQFNREYAIEKADPRPKGKNKKRKK